MSKVIVALAAVICLLAVGSVNAEIYTANFDADSEGWNDGTGTWYSTGGQDGGGFHTTMRNYWAPYLTPPSSGVLFGDVAGNFGNNPITFSYYLKSISQSMTSPAVVYMFADTDTTSGWDTWWKWTPADTVAPMEWTQFTWTVDPTAAVPSEGWEKGNDGPGTWAEGWQNIVSWNFWSGSGSGDNVNGIDTVLVSSIPEPTTIALLLGSMLMLLALRRR